MNKWPVHDAKARFSELLNAAEVDGPQIVLRRGAETAVVVSMREWQRLQLREPMSVKVWLLSDIGRGELELPERGRSRRRAIPDLS
ncbi:MAG: type II toxin-antitoxin system Phd/YefM family antitoxin [Bosea sp. (in: a-proteobacteria)]